MNRPLSAADLEGMHFTDQISIQKDLKISEGSSLKLRGLGLKKIFILKIFVAGLYLSSNVNSQTALDDVAKHLEVAYFQKIPGQKLAVETRQRIRDNVDDKTYLKLKDRIDAMDGFYVDIKPGDRYTLTYLPGKGTYFCYNGQLKGKIAGADFAAALFAVWVGNHPIDNRLKMKLLGET